MVGILSTNGETTPDSEGLCGTMYENIKVVKEGGCGRAVKVNYKEIRCVAENMRDSLRRPDREGIQP